MLAAPQQTPGDVSEHRDTSHPIFSSQAVSATSVHIPWPLNARPPQARIHFSHPWEPSYHATMRTTALFLKTTGPWGAPFIPTRRRGRVFLPQRRQDAKEHGLCDQASLAQHSVFTLCVLASWREKIKIMSKITIRIFGPNSSSAALSR